MSALFKILAIFPWYQMGSCLYNARVENFPAFSIFLLSIVNASMHKNYDSQELKPPADIKWDCCYKVQKQNVSRSRSLGKLKNLSQNLLFFFPKCLLYTTTAKTLQISFESFKFQSEVNFENLFKNSSWYPRLETFSVKTSAKTNWSQKVRKNLKNGPKILGYGHYLKHRADTKWILTMSVSNFPAFVVFCCFLDA